MGLRCPYLTQIEQQGKENEFMLRFVFSSRLQANRFAFHLWLFPRKILAFLVVSKNVKGKMILKHLSDVICRMYITKYRGGNSITHKIALSGCLDTYSNCCVIV